MSLTAVQLEQRKHGLGSSDVAAVLGLNPFKPALSVWLDKTGRSQHADNDQADLGNEIEEVIARRAIRKLGVKDAFKDGTHVHPGEPWALATPDYRLGARLARWLLECKNVGYRMLHHWGDAADARLPEYVEAQVHWQMGVTGAERAHVGALLGGRDLVVIEVPHNPQLFADMLEIGGQWWRDHVVADVQPEVDGSKAAAAWLLQRFPRSDERVLVADDTTRRLARDLKAARAAARAAAAAEARAAQLVQEAMGDAAVLELGPRERITWRTGKQGRVAWEALARSLAECNGVEPAELDKLIDGFRGQPGRTFNAPRSWAAGDEEAAA